MGKLFYVGLEVLIIKISVLYICLLD